MKHLANFVELEQHATTLESWWTEVLPTLDKPDHQQFIRWARIHSDNLEPMRYGMLCASRRLISRPFNDASHPSQYVSARANDYRVRLERAA